MTASWEKDVAMYTAKYRIMTPIKINKGMKGTSIEFLFTFTPSLCKFKHAKISLFFDFVNPSYNQG